MYFEEDLIDWGDGWEDNEDGERIPVLAMDGTKPACLRIENLKETIDTPTENNSSITGTFQNSFESGDEDQHSNNNEPEVTRSSETDLTESYSESIHEENYQQPKSSWDEPIENNLISRMTSNPPLHPKAANDNSKRKRFTSPPTNVQRISRFDQPPLPESRQGYGQSSSRLSTADASYSSHPNVYHFATSEPRWQMNPSRSLNQSNHLWLPPLANDAFGRTLPVSRWQSTQNVDTMQTVDRWHFNERTVQSQRTFDRQNWHHRQHQHQYSRRKWY